MPNTRSFYAPSGTESTEREVVGNTGFLRSLFWLFLIGFICGSISNGSVILYNTRGHLAALSNRLRLFHFANNYLALESDSRGVDQVKRTLLSLSVDIWKVRGKRRIFEVMNSSSKSCRILK